MTSCRFSRWRISAILDFKDPIMGSLKSPCTTSYRSSIDTIALNCLVFWENRVFCILATHRQTNKQTTEQTDTTDALSRSRYRERRLKNTEFEQLSYSDKTVIQRLLLVTLQQLLSLTHYCVLSPFTCFNQVFHLNGLRLSSYSIKRKCDVWCDEVGTLAVGGWAVTFGIARRGLGGAAARPGPSSLYQM